jgi:HK97 gp10 family phage protein
MADKQNLTGFKELAEKLKQLPKKVAKNGLRRAVSSGAAIVRNAARKRAPVDTGEMKRDIMMKREKDKQGSGTTGAVYSVYVRSGKKSRLAGKKRDVERDSFYWKFVEFGTKTIPAQPFMRPGFEESKGEAIGAIGKSLDETIQAAARDTTT